MTARPPRGGQTPPASRLSPPADHRSNEPGLTFRRGLDRRPGQGPGDSASGRSASARGPSYGWARKQQARKTARPPAQVTLHSPPYRPDTTAASMHRPPNRPGSAVSPPCHSESALPGRTTGPHADRMRACGLQRQAQDRGRTVTYGAWCQARKNQPIPASDHRGDDPALNPRPELRPFPGRAPGTAVHRTSGVITRSSADCARASRLAASGAPTLTSRHPDPTAPSMPFCDRAMDPSGCSQRENQPPP